MYDAGLFDLVQDDQGEDLSLHNFIQEMVAHMANVRREYARCGPLMKKNPFMPLEGGESVVDVASRLTAALLATETAFQGLYIKQFPSGTPIAGQEEEPDWIEYNIKVPNMFIVDKYQQIGFFPKEKAYSLRYQTAGMLETVLRAGVLGEDNTGTTVAELALVDW